MTDRAPFADGGPIGDKRSPDLRTAGIALFAAAAYVAVSVFVGRVVLVPGTLSVAVAVGAVVPLVFVLGSPATVGVVVGGVVTALVGGLDVDAATTVTAVALVAAVTLVGSWQASYAPRAAGDSAGWRPTNWETLPTNPRGFEIGPFVSVTVVATAAGAGFFAWAEFLHRSVPFALTATGAFVGHVVATAAVTPLVVAAVAGVFGRDAVVLADATRHRTLRLDEEFERSVATIALAWPVFGTAWGLGVDVAEPLLPIVLARSPVALSGVDVAPVAEFGQAVLGGSACLLLAVALVRVGRRQCGGTSEAGVEPTDCADGADPAGNGTAERIRLTRRDALAALAGGGTIGVGQTLGTPAGLAADSAETIPAAELTDDRVGTVQAVATVVYPSTVDATTGFVETYLGGLGSDRTAGIVRAAERLDERSQDRYGAAFARLSIAERETLLTELGVDRVASDPNGSVPQRIRYHLVNELLYALFTSPTGSSRFGVENPVGYPGGYDSYQRGPGA